MSPSFEGASLTRGLGCAVNQAAYDACAGSSELGKNPADPYMTALCYFNALRELGGARRIVEDEVRDRAARYGTQRQRVDPKDSPFADREITPRLLAAICDPLV
jgi:hypothetical protein